MPTNCIYLMYFFAGCWAPSVFHCWLRSQDRAGKEETSRDAGWDQRWSSCKGDKLTVATASGIVIRSLWMLCNGIINLLRKLKFSPSSYQDSLQRNVFKSLELICLSLFLLQWKGWTCSRAEWRDWEDACSCRAARGRWERRRGPAIAGNGGEDSGLEKRSRGQNLNNFFVVTSLF